ncbi:bifunctional folylpolyglutamate synthase/dihydrofolate synthase [Effusibacillus pohliae]|uniref:bifunctional folylpolyglutamate synthase/dihydrofolate synthase n=1 Tax=Effusibacillus pohliae TaxID=232270 RepID=UPI0012E9CA7D|nr:folylpolyglutamate synthase/dihydrofolate synthase family protein [Effusibacillus pohliae]
MILQWISSFPRFDGRWGIKLGLERMQALLARLGNPHRQLRFIHVAGTNGKGSTCAFLASIYQQAGYRVGRYTSPYIIHFFDRMSVNGVDVTEAQLSRYAEQLKPQIAAIRQTEIGEPTEFEVITLLAILFFLDQQVDVVVWETGLGGRLDATNVVTPLASVITNVGLDHQLHLGPTIEDIAREKAGIAKPGVPLFTAAEQPALNVILAKAAEVQAPAAILGADFSYRRKRYSLAGQTFDFESTDVRLNDLEIRMLGEHQCKNASLAVATALHLSQNGTLPVSEQALRSGLQLTRWPGRLEIVREQPLVLLDGAHNPHGTEALAAALDELLGDRKVLLVIGILQDKLVPGVLDPILPFAGRVIVTAPNSPRAADVNDVAMFVRDRVRVPIEQIPHVAEAVQRAVDSVQTEEAVLVTGSLYTISEARQFTSKKG